MLGHRNPIAFGAATLDDLVPRATSAATELGASPSHVQCDDEGGLVDPVHAAVASPAPADEIVVNAGPLTHGLLLRDALEITQVPNAGLYLASPHIHAEFRHTEAITGICDAAVAGFGAHGYSSPFVPWSG